MNRLFNIDNPIMQFISKIFDLVMLNLIFVLSCIPSDYGRRIFECALLCFFEDT